MWKDEIVEEVRRIREENAAKFDHDIDAIVADARRLQRESGRGGRFVPATEPVVYLVRKPVVEKAGPASDPRCYRYAVPTIRPAPIALLIHARDIRTRCIRDFVRDRAEPENRRVPVPL